MSDLILTSYLENGKLKVKIVQDSEELWLNLINKFKQKYGPKTKQSTIEKWQQEEKRSFSERVLEHTTYWLLADKYHLDPKNSRKDHNKIWELTNELDLYQRIKLVEHLLNT